MPWISGRFYKYETMADSQFPRVHTELKRYVFDNTSSSTVVNNTSPIIPVLEYFLHEDAVSTSEESWIEAAKHWWILKNMILVAGIASIIFRKEFSVLVPEVSFYFFLWISSQKIRLCFKKLWTQSIRVGSAMRLPFSLFFWIFSIEGPGNAWSHKKRAEIFSGVTVCWRDPDSQFQ